MYNTSLDEDFKIIKILLFTVIFIIFIIFFYLMHQYDEITNTSLKEPSNLKCKK